MTASELPKIISVDDHLVEPAHLFERWLPKKFHYGAPRVERRTVSMDTDLFGFEEDPDGVPSDVWIFGKAVYVPRRAVVVLDGVDTSAELRDKEPVTFDEMDPACYDPQARLKAMDEQGVEASLGFPSFPRFCGQAFSEETENDRELGVALIRAYNDWQVEEWGGDSGGRLVPVPVVPLWDAELAAAEVRRNAARGVHAVAFSEVVGHLGYPSIHDGNWDPFFAACEETETVVCMHIGSSSLLMPLPPQAPLLLLPVMQFANSYASMADFVFSGVLDRFPQLKLAYSEGQAGWIPYAMERMDHAYAHHTWALGDEKLKEKPSTYVRRNMWGCIFADKHAIASAEHIGVDNLMFEVDFPHSDGPFPHTRSHLADQFAGVDPAITYRIVRGNAIRLYQLPLDQHLDADGRPLGAA